MSAALLFLALGTAAGLVSAVTIARRRIRAHGLGVLLWRWLTGEPHHGQALTDAGWSRPGTRALAEGGHVRRWWFRTRRYRAARRTGSTAAVLLVLWGLLAARTVTLVIAGVAIAAGTALGVRAVIRRVRDWRHHRTWTAPAHLVAAPIVGLSPASDPREWLEVAADRSRVVAVLPPGFNPDQAAKARLVGTLTDKLGLEAPVVRWQLAGPAPRLEITQSAPPPPRVTLADVRQLLDRLKPDDLLWGLARKRQPATTSLSGDSPHIGLSMGSGAGKSVTARSLLAQMLYRGAIGIILDVKFISHPWAATLPNVVIARRPAEIHDMLLWLAAEVDRRNEVALASTDEDGNVTADVGPRILLVGEELNATMARLKAHWRETRTKDDPPRSPAIEALDSVSFMGRQVKVNILYIGQRLSDKATGGGGDARENIAVIAFARWRAATWKMLAPDFTPPPKSLTPGRLVLVSDQVQEVQGIFMTAAEARELATSGTVAALPWNIPGAQPAPPETAPQAQQPAIGTAPDQGTAIASGPPPRLPASGVMTLREAVEAGLLGDMKLAGARTARHRHRSTFPRPVGRDGVAELFDPIELAAWTASRKD